MKFDLLEFFSRPVFHNSFRVFSEPWQVKVLLPSFVEVDELALLKLMACKTLYLEDSLLLCCNLAGGLAAVLVPLVEVFLIQAAV